MDSNKKPWPIATMCGIRDRIDTNPDFQRPAVWSRAQKQLLIDTILRGYDIPKIYWMKTGSKPDEYAVVDGQQRIRAIWEYQAGEYGLPKSSEPIDSESVGGLYYEQLPDTLRMCFDTYPLDIVIMTETDDEEIREMFLRLQNGTSLKAQEKRNAMPGRMRDFVKDLATHEFFESCHFSNRRYTYDHIAGQMILMELSGGPCNVKNADLNRMYDDQRDFDTNSPKARKVRRVLDYLVQCFPGKTPELERYNAVSLYALVSALLVGYVADNRQQDIAEWFVDFEAYRKEQIKLPEDEAENEIVAYHNKTSHSTDSVDSIQWRHNILMRRLFERHPDFERKDGQRVFSHEQRMTIFRRDKGVCKLRLKCDGAKCEWDAWEADHIVAWSKGGKTIVSNGQVACPACNAAKGNQAA